MTIFLWKDCDIFLIFAKNIGNFCHFSIKTYVGSIYENHVAMAILINIFPACLYRELTEIVLQLPPNTP